MTGPAGKSASGVEQSSRSEQFNIFISSCPQDGWVVSYEAHSYPWNPRLTPGPASGHWTQIEAAHIGTGNWKGRATIVKTDDKELGYGGSLASIWALAGIADGKALEEAQKTFPDPALSDREGMRDVYQHFLSTDDPKAKPSNVAKARAQELSKGLRLKKRVGYYLTHISALLTFLTF